MRESMYEELANISSSIVSFFFFQAEDGIRDLTVTGVQTCALPISHAIVAVSQRPLLHVLTSGKAPAIDAQIRRIIMKRVRQRFLNPAFGNHQAEIGRASCRERV